MRTSLWLIVSNCVLCLYVSAQVHVLTCHYTDTDSYHGRIIGYNSTNLQQLPQLCLYTTPNSTVAAFDPEGGVWMAGLRPIRGCGRQFVFCVWQWEF